MVASPRDPTLLPVSVQDLAAPDETSERMVVFASNSWWPLAHKLWTDPNVRAEW